MCTLGVLALDGIRQYARTRGGKAYKCVGVNGARSLYIYIIKIKIIKVSKMDCAFTRTDQQRQKYNRCDEFSPRPPA